jgi:hypothetical protein
MYISVETLKNSAVMLRLISDIFRMLILYSTLNTGDKSLNVHQEYNTNIGKMSLIKRNITAEFFNVSNISTLIYILQN